MDVLHTIHQRSKQLRAQVFPANMHGFSGRDNIICMVRIEPRASPTSPSPAMTSTFRLDAFPLMCRCSVADVFSGLDEFIIIRATSSLFGFGIYIVAFRLNRRRGTLPFWRNRRVQLNC